ncbi:type II toxin-antitoxin system VapC family toxin, partial [bacterium]|nr:type II toxin-antitoxin system VapC family toxin [bacterium]
MRILLDTHVFIWWITDDPQLSSLVREKISDGGNELFFSAASCWEIAIKARLGKISLPQNLDTFIFHQMSANSIKSLPVLARHALNVFFLPDIHKDPFDRILISQAILEELPMATSDPMIA